MHSLNQIRARNRKRRRERGASMTEVLAVVVLIGLITAISTIGLNRAQESSAHTKLASDVRTINSAIGVYLASGGSLEGLNQPQAILDKLKTRRDDEEALRFAGLSGSMIDKRLSARMQTSEEMLTDRPRASWNPAKQRFEIRRAGGDGVAAFEILETLAKKDFGVEKRDSTLVSLNAGDGWIWDYEEIPEASPLPAPTVVDIKPVISLPPVPPSGPVRLRAPVFSKPGGTYLHPLFPILVTISNPNEAEISTLFWAKEWSGSEGVNWRPYVGPVPVFPGQQLLAYARADDSAYIDSYTTGENYEAEPAKLIPPEILADAEFIDLGTNKPILVLLRDPNPPGTGRPQIRLPGGLWLDYLVPIPIVPAEVAEGLTVEARTIAAQAGYLDSEVVRRIFAIKLAPPEIELSEPEFSDSVKSITVTLTNHNPESSSTPVYKLRDARTEAETEFADYKEPFEVGVGEFPHGFVVVAYARADEEPYLDSDEVTSEDEEASQAEPVIELPVVGGEL